MFSSLFLFQDIIQRMSVTEVTGKYLALRDGYWDERSHLDQRSFYSGDNNNNKRHREVRVLVQWADQGDGETNDGSSEWLLIHLSNHQQFSYCHHKRLSKCSFRIKSKSAFTHIVYVLLLLLLLFICITPKFGTAELLRIVYELWLGMFLLSLICYLRLLFSNQIHIQNTMFKLNISQMFNQLLYQMSQQKYKEFDVIKMLLEW